MDSQEVPPQKRLKLEKVVCWDKKKNDCSSKVYKSMYLDEKTADVHFVCGVEGERIPAHKCILSKASPVFDAMFYGKNATIHDKEYPETSADAFRDFLKLCYLDELVLSSNHIIDVMKLLHEYQMFEGLKLCGEYWADNMTIDDVCWAYHWAIHFEMDELKDFCEKRISAYPELVFRTQGFLACDYDILDCIIALDTLLCSERIVLQACLDWACNACERNGLDANNMDNLRLYLKDSLFKVRYGSMTPAEFCAIMDSKSGLFTNAEDYEEIFRLTTKSGELKTGRFNPIPRSTQITWKENRAKELQLINLLDLSRQTFRDRQTIEVSLESSQPILLGGFYCSPVERTTTAKVTIGKQSKKSIFVMSSAGTKLHTGNIELSHETETYFELAHSPIVIRPEHLYKIIFELNLQGIREAVYFSTKYVNKERKLDEQTTVTIDGHTFISRFKFILL